MLKSPVSATSIDNISNNNVDIKLTKISKIKSFNQSVRKQFSKLNGFKLGRASSQQQSKLLNTNI